ncbi:hypothetical protein ACGFZK_30065 [Streptomyces sp. NPDC048257]|uniref:hypothetical protein n=1 Tax=Streptomyces sp. NPDC048257 TaxID=3365526 RepID=UPI0037222EE9
MAMGQKAARDVEDEPENEGKKLDLSAAQVAGSSLATVAAALLASKMGVYGTILGAGVVSVVATAGGPVIQHLFRRTGDQLRESARPRARQVPLPREESRTAPTTDAPRTPQAAEAAGTPVTGGAAEEFGAATVHGTRVRGLEAHRGGLRRGFRPRHRRPRHLRGDGRHLRQQRRRHPLLRRDPHGERGAARPAAGRAGR